MADPSLDLVTDIGGTNTRVALARAGALLPESVTRFRNADYSGLNAVLTDYLSKQDNARCGGVCAALAGPVRDGKGKLTNLDWDISEDGLADTTGAETALLVNDLQAQGYGLDDLAPDALRKLVDGRPAAPEATKLVIGVGTGFNVAAVYYASGGVFVSPAEAGHASLPARDTAEADFIDWLEKAHGFAAVEDMLSGRGFERIYRHIAGEERPAADIMARVEDGYDPHAQEAARRFVDMLGAVAGDLALIHLPFGGIYFVGGVARAFTPYFERLGFETGFRDKGRFGDFMGNFPVWVVEDDYAALTGCAAELHARHLRAKSA